MSSATDILSSGIDGPPPADLGTLAPAPPANVTGATDVVQRGMAAEQAISELAALIPGGDGVATQIIGLLRGLIRQGLIPNAQGPPDAGVPTEAPLGIPPVGAGV